MRVKFKDGKPEGWYDNFITGFWVEGTDKAQVWGRPADVAQAPDGTLYVVDDTGAGDCFVGTHLAGLDAGLTPAEAAARAGVAASLSCRVPGARGAPRPDQVTAVLDQLHSPAP